MNFGIPKSRGANRKNDFHPNVPAIRMVALTAEGVSRKFLLNSKAAEMLGISKQGKGEDPYYVSLSFDGGIYIVNSTGIADVEQYRITKNTPYSFSNKRLYEYFLKNIEGLTEGVDNDFALSLAPNVGGEDVTAYQMSLLQSGEEYTEKVVVDAVEETTEETTDATEDASEENVEMAEASDNSNDNHVDGESVDNGNW